MKTLAQDFQRKSHQLKKIALLFLFILLSSTAFSKAPKITPGAEIKVNFANQIANNPSHMAWGNSNWKRLTAYGADLYWEIKYDPQVAYLLRVGYMQKGFIQPSETLFKVHNGAVIEAPVSAATANKNVFHYAHFDIAAKHTFIDAKFSPYISAGFRLNCLLTENLGSEDLFNLNGNQYYNYKYYKRLALGMVAGGGFQIDKHITIGIETDLDFSKSVNTTNLSVRNWVNSIVLGFNFE